jgi:hypothetical protein
MYDRPALIKIQEEEELSLKNLPEEQQKMASAQLKKQAAPSEEVTADSHEEEENETAFELPPLISLEKQAEKKKLLA